MYGKGTEGTEWHDNKNISNRLKVRSPTIETMNQVLSRVENKIADAATT